jgi:hypothetical protein
VALRLEFRQHGSLAADADDLMSPIGKELLMQGVRALVAIA